MARASVHPPTIACERCRLRKTRCDRSLPKCRPCQRAGADCLTIDPTGRSVPRSYLSHLEARVSELETALKSLAHSDGVGAPQSAAPNASGLLGDGGVASESEDDDDDVDDRATPDSTAPPGGSGRAVEGFLGASSGLTFTTLLRAALKEQLGPQAQGSDGSAIFSRATLRRRSRRLSVGPKTVLPPKAVAEQYLEIYFRVMNTQTPVLHREDFIERYFYPIYGHLSPGVSLASDHTPLNLVLRAEPPPAGSFYRRCEEAGKFLPTTPTENVALYFLYQIFAIAVAATQQHHEQSLAETLHLTARWFHSALRVTTPPDQLEQLQGLLLLAIYSVMRPASPGVWRVVGRAMRLCEELGLHNEEAWQLHVPSGRSSGSGQGLDMLQMDMRRRLFWCTYALDRQISVYLGRPLSLPDHSVRTPWPSLLDDSQLRRRKGPAVDAAAAANADGTAPSYKRISLAFFRIRQLQGQIQTVGYDHAELPRAFGNYHEWRAHVRAQLDSWLDAALREAAHGNTTFNESFFYLNYYQARLLLYGISPSNPQPSENDTLVIAHAGLQIIRVYAKLSAAKMLNYSWSAVHNLFMAGTSYLYVLYHHPSFRSNTSFEELTTVIVSVLEVLRELNKFCSAAMPSHDSFKLLAHAVMELMHREPGAASSSVRSTPQSGDEIDAFSGSSIDTFLVGLADSPAPGSQGAQGAQGVASPPGVLYPGNVAGPGPQFLVEGLIPGPKLEEDRRFQPDPFAGPGHGPGFGDGEPQSDTRDDPLQQYDALVGGTGAPDAPATDNVYRYLNEMSRSMIWGQFLAQDPNDPGTDGSLEE